MIYITEYIKDGRECEAGLMMTAPSVSGIINRIALGCVLIFHRQLY